MNKDNVLEIASNIFGNVHAVGNDLYKGVLEIDNKAAGVYYIDLTGNIAEDFEQYQENILAKEYYNNAGSLQWNYYLLLLQDQDKIKNDIKTKIETNNKYARKYVFDEKEFEDFFKLEKAKDGVTTNIIEEWKRKLDESDLQEVYSYEKQVDVLSRFEKNATRKLKVEANSILSKKGDDTVRSLTQLTLKTEYRKYPLEPRQYKFGKVNLIKGINGVGKTSLFEAIELIICGKSFRNPDHKEKQGCIEAVFNGSISVQKFDNASNEKYRDRDLRWYASNYPRDNSLYNSFNRYNFFNADAAYRFSTSNSDAEIKTALYNIILGPEYDHIASRIEKLYEKLRPIFNKITAELTDARRDLESADKDLNRYKKSDKLTFIRQAIAKNIRELAFANINLSVEVDQIAIEEINNNIQSIISNIITDKQIDSLTELKSKASTLEAKKRELILFQKEVELSNKEISDSEKTIVIFEKEFELLSKAIKYFSDDKFLSLEGLASRVKDSNAQLSKIEFIVDLLKELNLKTFQSESPIESMEIENSKKISAYKEELQQVEHKQTEFLERFSKVDQLVQEIKSLGNQFIEIDRDTESCPLCQSNFERAELEEKIRQLVTFSDVSSHTFFIDSSKRMSDLRGFIRQVEEDSQSIKTLRSAFSFSNIEYVSRSLDDVIAELSALVDSLNNVRNTNKEFLSLQNYADSAKVSEQELIYLKNRIRSEIGEDYKFTTDSKDVFESAILSRQAEISGLRESLSDMKERRFSIEAKVQQALELPLEKTQNLNEIKETLNAEERKLNGLFQYFEKLKEVIVLSDSTSVRNTNLASSILSKNIETLNVELQNQFELFAAQKRKDEASAVLLRYKVPYQRYKLACETLKSLIDEGGDEQLTAFLDSNLVEILDIFKSIHVPKEFSNIKLKGGSLYLVAHNKEERKITQISTGQRSALALSIFITLNRKLNNGPNIILFDDPVSFIDDLNALSFLDFLRLFVLRENKQIFFATANARLASLFEKKFNFLENDFCSWELKR